MSVGFKLFPTDDTGGDLRLLWRTCGTDDRGAGDRGGFDPLFSNVLFGALCAIFVAAGFYEIQLSAAAAGGERADLFSALLAAQRLAQLSLVDYTAVGAVKCFRPTFKGGAT